jgi:hypothetical protein
MGLGTGKAYKRNSTQLVFHHPLEMTIQVTINQEDVKGSLMVGYKDIRLFLIQVLTSLYTYRNEEQPQDNTSPQTRRIVAPEMTEAKSRTYNDRTGYDYRSDDG